MRMCFEPDYVHKGWFADQFMRVGKKGNILLCKHNKHNVTKQKTCLRCTYGSGQRKLFTESEDCEQTQKTLMQKDKVTLITFKFQWNDIVS